MRKVERRLVECGYPTCFLESRNGNTLPNDERSNEVGDARQVVAIMKAARKARFVTC
jgi:hypothetical protein